RDPGARPVLGNGAGRNVHVDVALLEAALVDTEQARPVLDDAERGLRTLLHDVAELSGEDELAAAGQARRLDEEDVAADRSPGKTGGHAGHARAHGDFAFELARAEDGGKVVLVDADRPALALGDAHGGVAERLADLALQITDA